MHTSEPDFMELMMGPTTIKVKDDLFPAERADLSNFSDIRDFFEFHPDPEQKRMLYWRLRKFSPNPSGPTWEILALEGNRALRVEWEPAPFLKVLHHPDWSWPGMKLALVHQPTLIGSKARLGDGDWWVAEWHNRSSAWKIDHVQSWVDPSGMTLDLGDGEMDAVLVS